MNVSITQKKKCQLQSKKKSTMSPSAQNLQYNVILSGLIEYSWISWGLTSSQTQSIQN